MSELNKADLVLEETRLQDEPTLEALEREKRAEAGQPGYTDLSAEQLNRIACLEWDRQSVVRGPITPPEWPGSALYCRRMDYTEMQELSQIYQDHGIIGAFCFRALNSKGERIFGSLKLFEKTMAKNWNVTVIERVVGDMATLCRTQLTDEELGKP